MKLKKHFQATLTYLAASIPVTLLLYAGLVGIRILLWRNVAGFNVYKIIDILIWEAGSVFFYGPLTCIALALSEWLTQKTLNIKFLNSLNSDLVLIFWTTAMGLTLGQMVMDALLIFSFCYGGPTEGCTLELRDKIDHTYAYAGALLWAWFGLLGRVVTRKLFT